MVQSE
ncbi:hypothetical protein SOVF_151340, partial [Spinacia oleracea]